MDPPLLEVVIVYITCILQTYLLYPKVHEDTKRVLLTFNKYYVRERHFMEYRLRIIL